VKAAEEAANEDERRKKLRRRVCTADGKDDVLAVQEVDTSVLEKVKLQGATESGVGTIKRRGRLHRMGVGASETCPEPRPTQTALIA